VCGLVEAAAFIGTGNSGMSVQKRSVVSYRRAGLDSISYSDVKYASIL
jgi:hypothetical protein